MAHYGTLSRTAGLLTREAVMARVEKLSEDGLRNELGTLDGWSLQNGKLHREFQFQDFNEAFGFMTRVALLTRPPEKKRPAAAAEDGAPKPPAGDGDGV